ncbi:MAG: ABC transporter ATP-binding protein [Thermodesulfobacteriota bacterium]|nr:ABC transporter ATP-binding protein [Thermodesulfobacteriota bacterium]
MSYLIEASRINKEFRVGSSLIHALKDIDIYIGKGDFVAIMGPSGSGKSTLLHILGCLERPSSGAYILDGNDVFRSSDRQLSEFRANHIGFVFQTFNLLSQLTVLENVELPFLYSSCDGDESEQRATRAIQQVGLAERTNHRPAQLSGGEMQRVAIARALAIEPTLILADEPTGNLDSRTSEEILELFERVHDDGATILMVTHDEEVASRCQRVMTLKDGIFIDGVEVGS